ncbi:DUF3662 and FHA domain-containing protein [Rothia sp. ZJ1223]|uniref:FhaA domain-containing protein n=1 Tax=Rothia sp. ZJ1223 TaxID=2811098 RepID=UPI00195AF626|nr:DUF3662 and FHA domain-containing protein [Rothia sp. ZJ1223]MBM7052278.1 FHA domain-containing protein [Rothia sp. ZJ1223]
MGFINKIEQGLEKAVRSTFSKGGQFEPVDIANRVRTEMDNRAYAIPSGRTIAPNVFTIEFAADDFHRVQDWGAPLAEELCDVAIRHARAQAYSLRGSVRVTFVVGDDLEPGDFVVNSSQEKIAAPHQETSAAATGAFHRQARTPSAPSQNARGEASLPSRIIKPAAPHTSPAYGGRAEPHRAAPSFTPPKPAVQVVLDINGELYSINSFPVVLGRGRTADITVEDAGVSRRHLEIDERDGTYIASDLGSTNGSQLDGAPLIGRREISNGSVISMGRARIIFRLMVPRS